MPDVEINCVQCREMFVFNEQDQELYYRRNMMQPQRCVKCRPARKKAAPSVASQTAAPNANSETAAKRFQITCDRCGRADSVPFAPKPGREVLCAECHGASRRKLRFA